MAQTGVPYYDLLKRLAAFQYQLGTPVRFRFQKETYRANQSPLTILSPVLDSSEAGRTLPLFTYSGTELLKDWTRAGYILLLDERTGRGEGEFLLTSKAMFLWRDE